MLFQFANTKHLKLALLRSLENKVRGLVHIGLLSGGVHVLRTWSLDLCVGVIELRTNKDMGVRLRHAIIQGDCLFCVKLV